MNDTETRTPVETDTPTWSWRGCDIDSVLYALPPQAATTVLDSFAHLDNYLEADDSVLAAIGVPRHKPVDPPDDVEIVTVTSCDETAPDWMRNAAAPRLLSTLGRLPETYGVAIVGGDRPGAYGRGVAQAAADGSLACGATLWCVASSPSGAVALEQSVTAGCPAVAVVDCGIDIALRSAIGDTLLDLVAAGGCVVSPHLPGTPGVAGRRSPAQHATLLAAACSVLVVGEDTATGPSVTFVQAFLDARRSLLCAVPKKTARTLPGAALALALADERGGNVEALGLRGPGARRELLHAPLAHASAYNRDELADYLAVMWAFANTPEPTLTGEQAGEQAGER